jgi:hypothetical protein
MLTHISTIEQLETEAKTIDEFLNITCSEDPNEVTARGCDLVVYIARTGKMLADAKYWKDKATTESILRRLDISLPASVLNKLIDAECIRENYIFTWVERLNRAATHQMDWCRTLISKAKVEMQYQNG